MNNTRPQIHKVGIVAVCLLPVLVMTLLSPDVAARGRGGAGGGHVRQGPASDGGLYPRAGVLPDTRREAQGAPAVIGAPSVGGVPATLGAPTSIGAPTSLGVPTGGGSGRRIAPGADRLGDRVSDGELRRGLIAKEARSDGKVEPPPRVTHLPANDPDMGKYREMFRQQNKDRLDWDGELPHVERPVAAAVVIDRATVSQREVRQSEAEEITYLQRIPCDAEEMKTVERTIYYRCAESWYQRAYSNGEIVYIQAVLPATP